MAAAHKGKTGGYLRAGHAVAGYTAGKKSAGHIHCRSGLAGAFLRGSE